MKKFCIVFFLLLFFLFLGCEKKETVLLPEQLQRELANNAFRKQVEEFDSPYTVCYQNKSGGYSLYIFSSPVQYADRDGYRFIDSRVVASSRERAVYENKANTVKTFFPENLSSFITVEAGETSMEFRPFSADSYQPAQKKFYKNVYGDTVEAVVYESEELDCVFYPVKTGVKAEYVFKKQPQEPQIRLELKIPDTKVENKQNGYLLFNKNAENKAVVYQPLLFYTNHQGEQIDFSSQASVTETEEGYALTFYFNEFLFKAQNTEYPVKLDFSMELYANKIPDSSVYSEFQTNSYLANYALVGQNAVFGEGWAYLRFRVQWVFQCPADNIVSVSYHLKTLYASGDACDLSLYQVNDQWSSTTMTWQKKSEPGELLATAENDLYDLTAFIKRCLEDEYSEMESKGGVQILKSGYKIIATSDNSLYPPYLKIDFKELPDYFSRPVSINPPTF